MARACGADYHALDAAYMVGLVAPPEDALRWSEMAIEVAEKTADERARRWLGPLYDNTGWTYHDRGEHAKALALFEEDVAFREATGQVKPARIARWSVARALRSLGRAEEARPWFARAHAELSKDDWLVKNEPARLARLCEKAGGSRAAALLASRACYDDAVPRAHEWLFLLLAVVLAAAYGIAHDHVTATVSRHYFLLAKGLIDDPRPYRLAVTILAVRATWWVGAIAGTALLLANGRSARTGPPLALPALLRHVTTPLLAAAAAALLGAALFALDAFPPRPTAVSYAGRDGATRFLVVWGAHAGSYAGSALGAAIAVWRVRAGARACAGPGCGRIERP